MAKVDFSWLAIEGGQYRGRVIRCTTDVPRKTAVVDWIAAIIGCTLDAARVHLARMLGEHPSVAESVQYHDFENEQHTPVADISGLLVVLNQLPTEFVAEYQDAVSTLYTRYLGGDTSLAQEIRANRQTQDTLPDSHPMRVFGEAVESGSVGSMPGAMRDHRHINQLILQSVTGCEPVQLQNRVLQPLEQRAVQLMRDVVRNTSAEPDFWARFNQAADAMSELRRLGVWQSSTPGGRVEAKQENSRTNTIQPPRKARMKTLDDYFTKRDK